MGMMTRRNVKRRVVKKTTPVVSFEKSEENNKQYTKTEINRMSTAELRNVAKDNKIDNANEFSGAELKKVLIEKFGL